MFIELAALVVLGQQSSSPMDSALVDGDLVHFFLPPFLVSEGRCLDARWSDDGQYLIVVSESTQVPPSAYRDYIEKQKKYEVSADVGIYIANMKTGVAKNVWHVEVPKPRSNAQIRFFRNSDVAVVQVSNPTGATTVLRVTGGTSKVEIIETLPSQGSLSFSDPLGKYVASTTTEPGSVRFIGPSGNVLRRQPFSGAGIAWSSDGSAVVLGISDKAGRYISMTPGGDEKWVSGPAIFSPFEELPPGRRIAVISSRFALPGMDEKVPLVLAAVRGEVRSIVVAVGAEFFPEGDSENGVHYTVGSLNMVRPVINIPKSAFDEMVARAERAKVMARLSQVGKALLMYSGDNDDKFPGKDDIDAIRPYIGDPSVLEGFAYNGLTQIGNAPANTEAGYMICPGGRAVLFQDGHVVFVPDRLAVDTAEHS